MKKFSLLMMALVVAATMSAEVVTMDFTSSTELTAMGVDNVPESGKSWNLGSGSLVKDGVTLTGAKNTASTDNRVFRSKGGDLTFRAYTNATITFTVTGEDLIKGLIFDGNVNFEGVELNKIATNAASVTLTCTANSTVKSVKVYINEDLPTITVDTISVSEAISRIDKGEKQACYVKGVVASTPFLLSGKYYAVWLTDINNPKDSIQAYKMRPGKAATDYASLDEMNNHYGLLDTVMIMAEGIDIYQGKYETTSGYYVSTLGKSSTINGNQMFKYAYGAVERGVDGDRFKYEVIFSKVNMDDNKNAVHFFINSTKELGVTGTYQIKNSGVDSSYIDGEGGASGSLSLKYVAEDGTQNIKYATVATFQVGKTSYHIDTTYSFCGWYSDGSEGFQLSEDIPFVPTEGQTITCAQAKDYALNVLAEGETSSIHVYVEGYANNVSDPSGNEQTFYMDDVKGSNKKTMQSFFGKLSTTQVTDSAKVRLYGVLQHYVKGTSAIAEIKNGDVTVLEGGKPLQRDITLEPVPAGAITVTQAKALADQLGASDTSEVVIVEGYVIDLYGSYSSQYKNQSFYMNDENTPGEKSHFEAFKIGIDAAAIVGDYVWVEGRLTKYVGESSTSYNIVDGKAHFAVLSTSIEEVVAKLPQTKAQKIFYKGNIYIVREGVVYNLQGNIIK